MPKQFQYHTGLEIIYTGIPIVIVLVLFFFTVIIENRIDATPSNPAVKITVTAFQWGWEFDYPNDHIEVRGVTTEDPDMVVPAGQAVQVTLVSADVIHGFYVPAFNFSRYAQPGITNVFDLNVEHTGDYKGQCTQYCGLYHSLMVFQVQAVTPSQYSTWVRSEQSHPLVQATTTSETAGSTLVTTTAAAAASTAPTTTTTVPTTSKVAA
jgi:cytochrome c oxidase subunit 2